MAGIDRALGVVLAGVAALAATTSEAADRPARPPNILLIFTDDHGYADLGAQQADEHIRTPHTDRLAADGIRFARGYVTGPQCVPSRAGVITGQHQCRFGVDDNRKGPLPLDVVTIPQRLRRAGYATGMSGKWHLDGVNDPANPSLRTSADHLPHAHGFDEYLCGSNRSYYASHDLAGQPLADAPRRISDERFRIVVQTEAALGFLDRRAARPEQPWFLYLPWFAPHVPLESPEPWFSRTPAELPLERRQALAMIAAMDDGLGQIRQKLRELEMERDTLIFFISDNGAPLTRGAWNGSLNTPLVGEKGMLTDGGLRVPFVAAWPGTLPAGTVYDHPVSALDVGATAVALAGLPHDDGLDGVNLMPYLTGQQQGPPHAALYWRWRSQAAVLEFPWKLVHLGERRYLFDVTHPEGETQNLIDQHPAIAARLDERFVQWSAQLKRPGPAEPLHDQDANFFAAHVDRTVPAVVDRRPRGASAADPVGNPTATDAQGWQCRNGTLAVRDGALIVTPDANNRGRRAMFLTRAGLNVPGPVTLVLRARSRQGGAARAAWRTTGQGDFESDQTVEFAWPAGNAWRDVEVKLPVDGRLIHLRILPPRTAADLEIQTIHLRSPRTPNQSWHFDTDG